MQYREGTNMRIVAEAVADVLPGQIKVIPPITDKWGEPMNWHSVRVCITKYAEASNKAFITRLRGGVLRIKRTK